MLRNAPPVLIIALTIFYVCCFGLTNLLRVSGWASSLPFLIGGLSCLLLVTKRYQRYILMYMAFLFGILAFNHVIVSFVGNRPIDPTDDLVILVIYFVHVPLAVIYSLYLFLVTAVIKWNCGSSNEGKAIAQGINFSLGYPWIVMYLAIFPFVTEARSIYSLCYVSMIPSVLSPIGNLILFLVLRDSEIDLLFKQRERQPQFSGRFKLVFFSVLTVGCASIVLEGYRGMWSLGFLSLGLFVTVSASLYSVFRNLFRARVPEPKPLSALQFLSSQRRWVRIWVVSFVACVLFVIFHIILR